MTSLTTRLTTLLGAYVSSCRWLLPLPNSSTGIKTPIVSAPMALQEQGTLKSVALAVHRAGGFGFVALGEHATHTATHHCSIDDRLVRLRRCPQATSNPPFPSPTALHSTRSATAYRSRLHRLGRRPSLRVRGRRALDDFGRTP